MSSLQRFVLVGLSGAAALLCAATSDGAAKGKKPAPGSCASAWTEAQARSEAGHLRQARDLLRECAKPVCGPVTMRECAARRAQLELDIPTVVPIAIDESGGPLVDVQVRADGQLLASRLDGRGLVIDPGVHEISFSSPDRGVFATEKVMIVEGQRNRPISVSLRPRAAVARAAPAATSSTAAASPGGAPEGDTAEAAGAAEAAAPKGPSAASPPAPADPGGEAPPDAKTVRRPLLPLIPSVIAGVGLASLGAGALLTFWGNQDNAALSACSPHCVQADVTRIRSLYLASDVTFAVGGAALGLAAVLFVLDRPWKRDDRPRAARVIDLQPIPSGAFASVRGTF